MSRSQHKRWNKVIKLPEWTWPWDKEAHGRRLGNKSQCAPMDKAHKKHTARLERAESKRIINHERNGMECEE